MLRAPLLVPLCSYRSHCNILITIALGNMNIGIRSRSHRRRGPRRLSHRRCRPRDPRHP